MREVGGARAGAGPGWEGGGCGRGSFPWGVWAAAALERPPLQERASRSRPPGRGRGSGGFAEQGLGATAGTGCRYGAWAMQTWGALACLSELGLCGCRSAVERQEVQPPRLRETLQTLKGAVTVLLRIYPDGHHPGRGDVSPGPGVAGRSRPSPWHSLPGVPLLRVPLSPAPRRAGKSCRGHGRGPGRCLRTDL